MSETTLQFISSNSTRFKAADYSLELQQTVTVAGQSHEIPKQTYPFSIQAERFTIAPDQILGVYPAPGSMADDGFVLPHIQFTRPTLPWERSPFVVAPANDTTPWLALLVFQDDDPPPQIQKTTIGAFLHGLKLETGQTKDDPVQGIELDSATAAKVLPGTEDLKFLAHCRKRSDDPAMTSVVVAQRLPSFGKNTTVMLVSLEGLYESPKSKITAAVRLLVLHQWNFTALHPKMNFEKTLRDLDNDALRLPAVDGAAGAWIEQGFVPLPHEMRQGSKTVSWIRGPLLPGANTQTTAGLKIDFPAGNADALLLFDDTNNLFDVSYATAYELGRLTLLKNTKVATEFLQWKRAYDLYLTSRDQAASHRHLPVKSAVTDPGPPPPAVAAFFQNAVEPGNLPWENLLPDANLLPQESIRFFQTDPVWQSCFLDGAFSIGATSTATATAIASFNPAPKALPVRPGFLLRSTVVSRYPALEIIADGDPSTNKPNVTRLAPDVLLIIFEKEVTSVSLLLALHVLHFALEKPADDYLVTKRDSNGTLTKQTVDLTKASLIDANGTIAVTKLAATLGVDSSDQFAFQMLAVPKGVQFKRST